MLYGIDTHIFFPPTMYTPGFEEENKTKPSITRKIESTDEGLTAPQAAAGLLAGMFIIHELTVVISDYRPG
jgi:3-dehydrosphinganine reductase